MAAAIKGRRIRLDKHDPRQRRQSRQRKCRMRERHARAKVIAVVGAGGKSTYIDRRAEMSAAAGLKTAVTTTTHIYDPCARFGMQNMSGGDETKPVSTVCGVDFFGVPDGGGKLSPVSRESFSDICRQYDVVFVEADGSRSMPAKIPSGPEPVLPRETDEVVVVMGKTAVGRPPAAVVQHYGGNSGAGNFEAGAENFGADAESCQGSAGAADCALFTDPLTEESLQRIAFHCYIQPIRRKFPNAKITYYLSDMYKSGRGKDVRQVTFVLMASGFGRRYSAEKNKLLEPVGIIGKSRETERLFQRAVLEISKAAALLQDAHQIRTKIAVVTRYPEIMDWCISKRIPGLSVYENPGAEEGITSSIRIGARAACASGSDAVLYFAADMPRLTGGQIARFAEEFIFSGKTFGCMAYREGKDLIRSVPGAFRLTTPPEKNQSQLEMQSLVRLSMAQPVIDQLLSLHGDRGAMKIIRRYPWDTYLFFIEKKFLEDIDYQED